MRKIYKELTLEQKQRGIIFSSELQGGGKVHEIHKDDENIAHKKELLLNDSFFNGSPYKANIIRQ